VTEGCLHHIITPHKECQKCEDSIMGYTATSLAEGLLPQMLKPKSGPVKQRRNSSVSHKKRIASSNLPMITVQSYQKLRVERGAARPKTCVPLFQYKVSVCDIQISVDLINLTG
jgi:hypothetical protein